MNFDIVGKMFKIKLKITIGIILIIILLIMCAYYSLFGEDDGLTEVDGEIILESGTGELQIPLAGNPPITSYPFRSDGTTWHGALDYGVPVGTPVHAAADGVVIKTANLTKSYGTYIVIQHKNGLRTWYAHGQYNSFQVEEGQIVKRGQLIMLSGNTGNSTGPHLHFEVRVKPYNYSDCRVDPRNYY